MLLDDCKIYPKFLLEESLSTHASFYTARSLTERLFYSLCLLLPYIHKNFLQSANLIKSSSHECIRTQVLFVNWRTSYYITSCFLWASLYHRSSSICKSTANEQTLLNGKWCKWAPQHNRLYPTWLESQFSSHCIYLNAKWDFSLKFGT